MQNSQENTCARVCLLIKLQASGKVMLDEEPTWKGFHLTEAAIQRCSYKKVFWKIAANSQENTHAEVRTSEVRTSAWMFSCKFAAYFQNTFS